MPAPNMSTKTRLRPTIDMLYSLDDVARLAALQIERINPGFKAQTNWTGSGSDRDLRVRLISETDVEIDRGVRPGA